MKKAVFYLFTLVMMLWLQVVADHFLGRYGWTADVILVSVLYLGLFRGPLLGVVLGFIWGLFIDAQSLGLLGAHAFLYAAAGYWGGLLSRQLDESKLWTQALFTLGVTLVYLLFYHAILWVFSAASQPFSWMEALEPISNAVVAPLIFWLLGQWITLWKVFPEPE